MDMTQSIAPKSDQLNADDLVTGPITVTISDVNQGNVEQPVNVNLVEFPKRAYRPSKSMRRVLVAAWGKDSKAYAGHQLTLYRNPDIMFGGQKVGGIEISHMTGITKALPVVLTVTRGKKGTHTVHPIIAPVQRDWLKEAASMDGDTDKLRAHWTAARDSGADESTLAAIHALATPSTPES